MSAITTNDKTIAGGIERRQILRGAGFGTIAAGALAAGVAGTATPAAAAGLTDYDILNFALNLEYLEAEFYMRAVTGYGLALADTTGIGTPGGVTGGKAVNFKSAATQQYANEIAGDELNHVQFLRQALGAQTVAEPQIDLMASFAALGAAAGLGSGFNPFASENDFLLGAYIFEDVGVTAYLGAAPLIHNKGYLAAAGAILAVEAYHASEVRVLLRQKGFSEATVQISALRANLSGAADDQGVVLDDVTNIVPTDGNSLVFSRTTRQVLNVVYGGINAPNGLFFPAGMNGTIK